MEERKETKEAKRKKQPQGRRNRRKEKERKERGKEKKKKVEGSPTSRFFAFSNLARNSSTSSEPGARSKYVNMKEKRGDREKGRTRKRNERNEGSIEKKKRRVGAEKRSEGKTSTHTCENCLYQYKGLITKNCNVFEKRNERKTKKIVKN